MRMSKKKRDRKVRMSFGQSSDYVMAVCHVMSSECLERFRGIIEFYLHLNNVCELRWVDESQ